MRIEDERVEYLERDHHLHHIILLFSIMTGTIKKKTDKGFGFITGEGLQKDLFFHSNSLVGVSFDELQEGDFVSFEVGESPKGPNAVNVQRVSADAGAQVDSEA